jgi:glutamine amidotransferase
MVLPGVGAFGAAVEALDKRGLTETINHHVASGGYLFGVCLGMQLLATASEESPAAVGLDLIHGQVRRLTANAGARVPNMGWGNSLATTGSENFPTFSHPLDYYFVHSFALVPDSKEDVLATSDFGELSFVSAVIHENVLGMQFHPEKSSRPGAKLLTEVLTWANG